MKFVECLYTFIVIFCFLSFCETQRITTLKLEIGKKYTIRCTTSVWISEPLSVLEIYFNEGLHFKATKAIGKEDFNLIETTVENKNNLFLVKWPGNLIIDEATQANEGTYTCITKFMDPKLPTEKIATKLDRRYKAITEKQTPELKKISNTCSSSYLASQAKVALSLFLFFAFE